MLTCDSTVIFEAFEVSSLSAEVLAAEASLLCDFPDCSATLPIEVFQQSAFQEALADFLSKGSTDPIRQFQPQSEKAKNEVVESRNPASR